MNRRRRAVVLSGLALVLGILAASEVGGREAALRKTIGPVVPVVVARADVPAGTRLTLPALAIRHVPARYAPPSGYSSARAVRGLRAAVTIPAGTDLIPPLLDDGSADSPGVQLRPGERIAEVVANGSADLVAAGSHVDVLVTTENADGRGHTRLALQDAEVVSSSSASSGGEGTGPRVAVSLRVTLRQAVRLAAAQNFAREIRVLPRPPVDRAREAGDVSAGR